LTCEPAAYLKRSIKECFVNHDDDGAEYWTAVMAEIKGVGHPEVEYVTPAKQIELKHTKGENRKSIMKQLDQQFAQSSPLIVEGAARKVENARKKRGRQPDPDAAIELSVEKKAARRARNLTKSVYNVTELRSYLKAVGESSAGDKATLVKRWAAVPATIKLRGMAKTDLPPKVDNEDEAPDVAAPKCAPPKSAAPEAAAPEEEDQPIISAIRAEDGNIAYKTAWAGYTLKQSLRFDVEASRCPSVTILTDECRR
jgi:hypothetical protein